MFRFVFGSRLTLVSLLVRARARGISLRGRLEVGVKDVRGGKKRAQGERSGQGEDKRSGEVDGSRAQESGVYGCRATDTGQRDRAYSGERDGHCAGAMAGKRVEKSEGWQNVVACPGRRAAGVLCKWVALRNVRGVFVRVKVRRRLKFLACVLCCRVQVAG